MKSSDRDISATATEAKFDGAWLSINGERLPARIFIFLLVFEISLVLLDAVVNYGKFSDFGTIRRLFNIAREDSLATWFMATQTFVTALVLWLIFLVRRNQGKNKKQIFAWGFLAGFFTYMSADDGALIHERMGTVFEKLYPPLKSNSEDGFLGWLQAIFPSYEWQLVALPLFVGAGLFMLVFLLREFRDRKRRLLLVFAVASMAIAVGLDFIEGLSQSHAWNVFSWLQEVLEVKKYTVRHFAKSLEEFLEMMSISLLLMLFVHHFIKIANSRFFVDFRSKSQSH